MEQLITVYKVRPKHGGPWLIVQKLAELEDNLQQEDSYEIICTSITQAEWNNIGEFNGW